jgi:hypothetical protein
MEGRIRRRKRSEGNETTPFAPRDLAERHAEVVALRKLVRERESSSNSRR